MRWVCGIVVEFFRSVPVLLMMYFAYRLFAVNGVFARRPQPARRGRHRLTLYNGSVIAELVRSGRLLGCPRASREAGLSIGLTAARRCARSSCRRL